MLRVGLTGGLGAGKSTAARMFAEQGATVLSSDEIGRELMEPGQAVYREIVERFGAEVVGPDGALDRATLARLAFAEGRAEELNAIVHPAVIARQEELMRRLPADAVVIVESALIFETHFGGGWRERFDKLVLVTAPGEMKIARFLTRAVTTEATREGLKAEARRRLAAQMPDEVKVELCNFVIVNDSDLTGLEEQVKGVWRQLGGGGQTQNSLRERQTKSKPDRSRMPSP